MIGFVLILARVSLSITIIMLHNKQPRLSMAYANKCSFLLMSLWVSWVILLRAWLDSSQPGLLMGLWSTCRSAGCLWVWNGLKCVITISYMHLSYYFDRLAQIFPMATTWREDKVKMYKRFFKSLFHSSLWTIILTNASHTFKLHQYERTLANCVKIRSCGKPVHSSQHI